MSASAQGMTQLWDAATGAEVTAIRTSAKLPQVVFSRSGDLILAATSDNAGHVMKTDGTELKVLVGHQSKITSADFSPDGQLVATASLDRTARIWSVNDGSTVATLKGHSDELTAVVFSSDGQSLLTSSRDGTVRIWSVSGGTEKVVLRGHSGVVTSAQFSPSGLYIVTASSPGSHCSALGHPVRAPDSSTCRRGGGRLSHRHRDVRFSVRMERGSQSSAVTKASE